MIGVDGDGVEVIEFVGDWKVFGLLVFDLFVVDGVFWIDFGDVVGIVVYWDFYVGFGKVVVGLLVFW